MLMHADAVAAWAQWATVGVAGGALWFAAGQVREARQTRERVAHPNVVVYVDLNPKDWQWFDLVVKNFGPTPAYNIRITLPRLDVKAVPRRFGTRRVDRRTRKHRGARTGTRVAHDLGFSRPSHAKSVSLSER